MVNSRSLALQPQRVRLPPLQEGASSATAKAVLKLSPREGELSQAEIGDVQRALRNAGRSVPENGFGLPISKSADGGGGIAQLLPSGIVPKRTANGSFALPLSIQEGAFGVRAQVRNKPLPLTLTLLVTLILIYLT